ncbi:6-phospho-beta-glucosidase [Halolactibacillus alkaliphilus]|uniref:6-phospho-beta-glucosidase n=1 Tax=Halolactibacillus alkaliphilus TaxID=442899 RepID=A0A511X0A2_9BACI|nr:6-phospho-beta-glucosidase [Halolactibacillus alkaliphilus]GEN56377.1 6-phospho-beta-glucosidase [Halolactibacillus alkaliphilus]GGN67449.1 6-phospho-beta-glucosidase [Halolactibacillus alkaliphilus]SFO92076.1 6-phospho-beta-glucosidase [Halolactibacillus alkaliphilus]
MERRGLKVVTIGGGSSYTPELIEGFIKRYDTFPIKELWLVDIEEGKEKLNTVGGLAKRMVEKAKIPMDIHLSLDRKAALKDADFVTTQFRVGQLSARAIDEEIPLKYGVIGQETNGPGGMFKALRTIPVMLTIVKEMEVLCPNAWLINFTNPAGMVVEAVFRHTNWKRIIGVCNVPIGMERAVAKALEVEEERVRIDFGGLNHMVFGLAIYLDGEDITLKAINRIVSSKSEINMRNINNIAFEADFIRALKMLPCPYHRYYYKQKEMLESELVDYKEKGIRAKVVQTLEKDLFDLYKNKNIDEKPKQLEQRGGAYYSDVACNLMESIFNDRGDIQTVNTLNNGTIASLSRESVIEASCVITKEGPRPIAIGDLPVVVRGLVQQIKSFERMTIEAAVTGDYHTALLAMTINPLVPSDTIAKQILDDMLTAHKLFLPQFK